MREYLERLSALESKNAAASSAMAELKASIAPQIDALVQERKEIAEKSDLIIKELIEEMGIEVLFNVESARIVYSAHYNHGTGSSIVDKAIRDLMKQYNRALVLEMHNVDRDNYDNVITTLTVNSSTKVDEKMEELMKIAEKIFNVQVQIMSEARFDPQITVTTFDNELGPCSVSADEDGVVIITPELETDDSSETVFEAIKHSVEIINTLMSSRSRTNYFNEDY